ncbi:MAG: hypothetical protein QOD01_283, partial [Actinomycetota bacterium]|nr:hypothetical protein [Actinomycetota bacterium]
GAERLRRCVAEVTAGSHLPGAATLSAGVAEAMPGESIEQVIGRADGALYRAKDAGRDQVVIDRSVPEEQPVR